MQNIEAFSFGIAAPSEARVEAPTSQRRDPRLSYENVGKLERELRRAQGNAAKLSAQIVSLGSTPVINVATESGTEFVSADVLALKLKIESLESELRAANEKSNSSVVTSNVEVDQLKEQIVLLKQRSDNSSNEQISQLHSEIKQLQVELADKHSAI